MENSPLHKWIIDWEKRRRVSSGVQLIEQRLRSDSLVQTAAICAVDLTDPFTELRVVSPGAAVGRLEPVRAMLEEQMKQGAQVVFGINGDFFSALGIPSGLQISRGEIVCARRLTKASFALFSDGSAAIVGNVAMHAELNSCAGSVEIDAVNRVLTSHHDNRLYLYTPRFGAQPPSPANSTEVLVHFREADAKLKAGQPLRGVVIRIADESSEPIPSCGAVLSAMGEKRAWIRKHLREGMEVEIVVSFDQGLNRAVEVISGSSTLGRILLQGGQVLPELFDPAVPENNDRHPRTMLGIRGNQVYAVVVDGRQPGYSDGLTFSEAAFYLQALGLEAALNIDGGGSTTCLARALGTSRLELVNRPSDGYERSVANGLAVVSTAPPAELSQLLLRPEGTVRVLKGSTLHFEVLGVDEYLNPVPVDPAKLRWSIQGGIGWVKGGELTVSSVGWGSVTASLGALSQTVAVEVVEEAGQIRFASSDFLVEPGSVTRLDVELFTVSGEPVHFSSDVLEWEASPEVGTIEHGCLTAVNEMSEGIVRVKSGNASAAAQVRVGQKPLLITGFQSREGLDISYRNAVPESVQLEIVANPVRFGPFAAKLSYDFRGQPGTSRATIHFLNEEGVPGRTIPGQPQWFGIWVYGSNQGHALRLGLIDASGNPRSLDLTGPEGIDWLGWRYVRCKVPANAVWPVTVTGVSLIEAREANKGHSAIYLDNFRAEYILAQEDVSGPTFSEFAPALGSVMERLPAQAVVKLVDEESGVNPNSIKVWVNDRPAAHSYDQATGILTIELTGDLGSTVMIKIAVTDNAGNPGPPIEWHFAVGAGDAEGRLDLEEVG